MSALYIYTLRFRRLFLNDEGVKIVLYIYIYMSAGAGSWGLVRKRKKRRKKRRKEAKGNAYLVTDVAANVDASMFTGYGGWILYVII